MSECDVMRETMPLLLTESLDPARRELVHQHIERCGVCGDAWSNYRETWRLLGDVPEVEVPARVRQQFISAAGLSETATIVPFRRRSMRWLAEAAAVVIVAGSAFYAGRRAPVELKPQPARIEAVAPYSIAESRVIPASAISPNIQGRPDIDNVSFFDANPNDQQIGLSFDITSHVTVTG